jgi:hypothetical protein
MEPGGRKSKEPLQGAGAGSLSPRRLQVAQGVMPEKPKGGRMVGFGEGQGGVRAGATGL